ncbi:Phosphoserine phosphatase [hydrothermal vent metagenome]|uniref:phosphoserine phosphatase n=1 Tax=hydrothermal vent metagenome TaxID=652676 RepID=A0A3B0SCB3_9ZZZZ
MKNLLTLISNPAQPALNDDIVNTYASRLEGVSGISWLSESVAVDIFFDGDLAPAKEKLAATLATENFDYGFQQTDGRVKKMLIADMDSTIIQCECIDELADYAGLKAKVSAITEAAMQGRLDFEQALRERVALLRGMEASVLDRVYAERVKLMPGAASLIKTMNKAGAATILVSGGFTFFTEKVAALTGFQVNRGNILDIKDGILTGKVRDPIVDSTTKLNSLIEFREKHKLLGPEVMAVGDGANDIPMIREAGLGIAYHPKPAAADAADITIRHADLTALLYLQGYSDGDFVAG